MAGKRIMLMYISEVSGHHSATLAIEKSLRLLSNDVEILNINAFNYTNPISEKIINRLYMAVIKRTPQVWDYLYDNPAVIKKLEKIKETIHKMNSPKLKDLFNRFRPDVVLCTQAFPCGMVADFKKIYNSDLPLISVLTDYIPHSYWVYDNVSFYITPSEEIGTRLALKGIQENRIKPMGIPCDPKFTAKVDKKEVLRKLGLDQNSPIILIMGGGQGLGPIKTIVASLEKLNTKIQEIVITGNNKRLYGSLKRKIRQYQQKILLFGYSNNIHELMDIADLIITKPGGITTAEALAKKLPMLIINPIPGQEENNTVYLTKSGAALKVDNLEEINLIVDKLVSSSDKLTLMRESALRIGKPYASMDIAKFLLNIKP